jgi:uncharacterized protein YjbI with pentapeptide repeats
MAESEKPGTWETWKAKHLRWRRQLTLWDAFIVFLLVGLVLIRLSGAHEWTFWSKDNRETIRDLALIIAAIAGVPFVIWREYSTHRAAKAAERQAETAAERHLRQTEADRERRITDSFTKAVELLGKPELEVRLGAIYALERIARESKHDHWPIMETLTAYVRTKAPTQSLSQSNQGQNLRKATSIYAVAVAEGTTEAMQGTVQSPLTKVGVDIQAVLTVLNRRVVEYEEQKQYIDLTEADLRGANLIGTNLSTAILVRTNLSGAYLSGNLRSVFAVGANLSGASLRDADLTWAFLEDVNLTRSDLTRTILQGADLIRADLSYADLTGTNLTGANLTDANLIGATLKYTKLEDAKFCRTILPNGTLENRDCPPEAAPPPDPSETPSAPN